MRVCKFFCVKTLRVLKQNQARIIVLRWLKDDKMLFFQAVFVRECLAAKI